MMKAMILVWLLATVLLTTSSTQAQQQSKVPRVGILFMGGKDQPHLEALKKVSASSATAKARTSSWHTGMPRAESTACRS